MNCHCYLPGMYDVASEATLLNLVSARWLHNNTHGSAESHVNARTAITWWWGWGVLCGVSTGLDGRSFFCDHIFAPTCYIRTPNNSIRCLQRVAGDNNKQGIVASSLSKRTSAIFNGGACWRINSTARILALNMQDLGLRIQCLQFHHVQWTKQLTTVDLAIQGTFPENAIHWPKKRGPIPTHGIVEQRQEAKNYIGHIK